MELTADVKDELMGNFDQMATEFVLSYRQPSLTEYFIFVTDVGDVMGYLVVLIISVVLTLFIIKKWKYLIQIFLVLILATLSNMVLKRFIERARP
ncbi:MAG: PAP2 family protein, partial [Pricia sp.]